MGGWVEWVWVWVWVWVRGVRVDVGVFGGGGEGWVSGWVDADMGVGGCVREYLRVYLKMCVCC